MVRTLILHNNNDIKLLKNWEDLWRKGSERKGKGEKR